jgi:hypothetical protein
MKKAILALLLTFVAAHFTECAHAARFESGSTTGLGDGAVNQSLAEEFARCAAFSDIAAACAKSGTREEQEQAATQYKNAAKRFYQGGHRLAGQEFMHRRVQSHDATMRRNAGSACEGFPALEQQHRKRCDDNARRLPRNLQQP